MWWQFYFLATKNEIYRYDYENLEKINIPNFDTDIINLSYLTDNGLLIITKDKIYIYKDKLKEYSNIKCTNVLEINKKIYYIKKNKLCNQQKTIQQYDFEIIDCCCTNCLVILSDCINIYEIDNCEKIAKIINCLTKKELTIPTSIAYIEQALANILNEEANKIKKALGLSNDICDLLKINESVNQTLRQVILLEQVLCTKLDIYNNKKWYVKI